MLGSYNKLRLSALFKLWWQTTVLGLGIVAIAMSALAESSSDILSKRDTAWTFAINLTEWNENVAVGKMYGTAEAIEGGGSSLMMATVNPTGFLMVHPIYEDPRKPRMIHVTVGYKFPLSANFAHDQAIVEALKKAMAEMQPEYTVIGKADRIGSTVIFYFDIAQKGVDRAADRLNADGDVCKSRCIDRVIR